MSAEQYTRPGTNSGSETTAGARSSVEERKYVMTRLEAGDYLLPSNDAQTLWWIWSYDDQDSGKTLWHLSKWDSGSYPTLDSVASALEMQDWSMWTHWSGPLPSRKAAIEEALRG